VKRCRPYLIVVNDWDSTHLVSRYLDGFISAPVSVHDGLPPFAGGSGSGGSGSGSGGSGSSGSSGSGSTGSGSSVGDGGCPQIASPPSLKRKIAISMDKKIAPSSRIVSKRTMDKKIAASSRLIDKKMLRRSPRRRGDLRPKPTMETDKKIVASQEKKRMSSNIVTPSPSRRSKRRPHRYSL